MVVDPHTYLRNRMTSKGGPDGGDGGRGGHVIVRGNAQMWTLLPLKYQKHIKAASGENGSGQERTGANGDDRYIEVPLGTIAKDEETGEVLFEITDHGQEHILVKGGRGGLGNVHFKSSTFQTPSCSATLSSGVCGILVCSKKSLLMLVTCFAFCRQEHTVKCRQRSKTRNCKLSFYNFCSKFGNGDVS